MPRARVTPTRHSPTFTCTTCDARVLEHNRVLHNVVCQRNATKANTKTRGRRKPDTAYAHSVYKQYAQSHSACIDVHQRQVGEPQPFHENHYDREQDGVYRNVSYMRKLADERAAVATPSEAPSSPALSVPPFPLSTSIDGAAAYDMPSQVLPPSRSRQVVAPDMPRHVLPSSRSRQVAAPDMPRHVLPSSRTREVGAQFSDAFRQCQYCGREYSRVHHMTHELQCAFTTIQCARCAQYLRRVDEQYHLHSGCLRGVLHGSTRSMVTTTSREIGRQGREMYTTDLRKMAGAAAFALAAYFGSRLASRGGRGGDGPHIRYETVNVNGTNSDT